MLNCKPGDLAMVVNSSEPINDGKIVTCIKLQPPGQWRVRSGYKHRADIWEVNTNLTLSWGVNGITRLISDKQLRPLRDPRPDEVDETLVSNPVEIADIA